MTGVDLDGDGDVGVSGNTSPPSCKHVATRMSRLVSQGRRALGMQGNAGTADVSKESVGSGGTQPAVRVTQELELLKDDECEAMLCYLNAETWTSGERQRDAVRQNAERTGEWQQEVKDEHGNGHDYVPLAANLFKALEDEYGWQSLQIQQFAETLSLYARRAQQGSGRPRLVGAQNGRYHVKVGHTSAFGAPKITNRPSDTPELSYRTCHMICTLR